MTKLTQAMVEAAIEKADESVTDQSFSAGWAKDLTDGLNEQLGQQAAAPPSGDGMPPLSDDATGHIRMLTAAEIEASRLARKKAAKAAAPPVEQMREALKAYDEWAGEHIHLKPDAWRDNSATIDEKGMERLREIEEMAEAALAVAPPPVGSITDEMVNIGADVLLKRQVGGTPTLDNIAGWARDQYREHVRAILEAALSTPPVRGGSRVLWPTSR